jgi:hypothetical protein
MTREQRNSLIDDNKSDLSNSEIRAAYALSAYIGDDEEIEFDFDEIEEVTSIHDPELIEEMLDVLYDLGILQVLSYEDSILG